MTPEETKPKPIIKAIKQEHRGDLFRSRSEAKWREFFWQINLPVYYEYQGYDLGDGIWYLPDFYIPKWKCYFEIKDPGVWESDSRREIEFPKVKDKAWRLYKKTNHMVIICYGGFGNESGSDFMHVIFPGFNPTIFGFGIGGWGTFGTCNEVDVLHLKTVEYEPRVIALIYLLAGRLPEKTRRETIDAIASPDERELFEIWINGLSREERIEQCEKILELGDERPDYSRQFLIPLHSSVGFNFAMIKDEEQDCKIFAPFSDPLLCSFNAPYFNKFKPYTKAYKVAKQLRFERKSGKFSSNVL